MIARKYVGHRDFEMLLSWWNRRAAQAPDQRHMAPTGFVVVDHDEAICAGFLFKTDARVAVISHVVSNPDILDKKRRGECIDLLMQRLIFEAHTCGFEIVSASSNLPRLNKRYEKLGFAKSDEHEVHYWRKV